MKNLRKAKSHLVVALYAVILIATAPSLEATEIQVEQRAFYVPEVFITDFSPGYCVALVSVLGGNIEARKELYFKLADATFQEADPANQKFKIAGVDFVDFNSLHLVSDQHCGIERQFDEAVSMIEKATRDCADTCRVLSINLSIVHHSGLVTTLESVNGHNPVSIHQTRARGESVASCAIGLPTNSNSIDDPIRQSLSSAIWKYGLPIMDVFQIDDRYFLLISRDCAQKVSLFELVREILNRDNSQQLKEPDYSPDVTEYVFSQTGK